MDNLNFSHNFGTDPEAFVYTELVDTKFGKIPEIIPPAALVEDFGMKMEQIEDKKVLISGNGFQWSEDGAAIEMQIDPQDNAKHFFQTVNRGIGGLTEFLKDYDMKLWVKPLGHFDPNKYWKGRDLNFQTCVLFGCDPDEFPELYYDLGLEDSDHTEELDVSTHEFRYGGAHIHIQSPLENPHIYFEKWSNAAIIFDFFAGMLNTFLSRKQDIAIAELARLKYYGKPGRIRLQAYNPKESVFGIEYRVMSNHWLQNYPKTRALLNILDIAAEIVESDLDGNFVENHQDLIPEMYKSLISLDRETAGEIYKKAMAWALNNGFIDNSDLENLQITMQKRLW
jgi:hypothetical protein